MGARVKQLLTSFLLVPAHIQDQIYSFSDEEMIKEVPAFLVSFLSEETWNVSHVEIVKVLPEEDINFFAVVLFLGEVDKFLLEVFLEDLDLWKLVSNLFWHLGDNLSND